MKGLEIYQFAKELWPINRSITGEGVRLTLERIKLYLPDLEIKAVPSGTDVFDCKLSREKPPFKEAF